jgi:hypothetical protein
MTKKLIETPTTIPFEAFWRWLQAHPNCIIRAGTPEAVLFDDDDLHWHFGTEEDGAFLVQLLRGKKVQGELVLQPGEIAYVECQPGDPEEFIFECITETPEARLASYHFVLSHGYDNEEPISPGRFVH